MSDPRRTGRRPGDPEVTKRAILDSARIVFGEAGFDRATIRAIAERAGVDPALVHHHFGTKQRLFVAAHELPVDPAEMIASLGGLPKEQLGERIARLYLTVLAAPGSPVLSLIRTAATNEAAARMLREYVDNVLLSNAPKLIDAPDARLRVALTGSHMIGVVIARSVLCLPEISDLDAEDLVAAVAPTLQRYLTDPDAIGHRE